MNAKKNKMDVHFSSKTDDWATPQDLFDSLNAKYGPFELDVCATKKNAKCKDFFNRSDNGLETNWVVSDYSKEMPDGSLVFSLAYHYAKCWMNPPYGRGIGAWVRKAYEESLKGCLVVCLLPARTDTRWFHDYCTKGEIEFIKGRLKFGGSKNSAPFPSMIVVFRPPQVKS